jgi:N-acetylglutamate synthase
MSLNDFDQVISLWQETEGVGLNESDSRECIAQFLTRNRGMSFVVRDGHEIIGAVLCGHDGRRGYLHHLAVAKPHRNRGIGKKLVEACLAQLERAGILKCNIFLYANNEAGEAFWKHNDWSARTDLVIMQKHLGKSQLDCGC